MAGTGFTSLDNAPLVAGVPIGTMSTADIYPTHSGIGGITTQDRALPAFAEATSRQASVSSHLSNPAGLIGTPAGYFALILLGLAVFTWLYR